MNKPRGYTMVEVLASIGIIAVFFGAMLCIVGPRRALEDVYRDHQLDDIASYMITMLEKQSVSEVEFYEELLRVEDQKIMIGQDEDCSGSYGKMCMDQDLADACFTGFSLEDLVVDVSNDEFSKAQTGYYLLYENDVLEIGACAPFGVGPVRLMSLIK